MNKRDQSDAFTSNYELYFLITKFLEAGPCSKSVEALKNELSEYEILPKRFDWEGNQHEQTYDELEQKFRHIGPQHLVEICQRIGPLLDKEIPPCISGLSSLLGSGRQSIMRTHKDTQRTWRSLTECSVRRHQMPLLNSINRRNNHIVNVLHGREISGPFSRKQAFPPRMYSRMQLLSRTLGHLSAVYCCLFDGSGRYVITGADDMLIKVWSAVDGRLLATLRGVLSELTDIAINLENTLLAAGSVDRIIRVWCLQTAFPIAVLIAHTGMITGVNFCPGIINGMHYLASTSTDGSVAFWSYTVGPNNVVSFHSKALQYNEKMRPGQAQMICASFSPGGMFMAAGSADHHVRVYKMVGDNEADGPHRILETEPHTDRVDSIQWAHSGLRFISGSKDGTAIIWKFTRQRWKTLVLNMTTKLPGKPDVVVDPKLKLKVTMVCWNTNDKWAITACNDHSIKVWDSEAAKLFEVLRGHKEEVFVLESHPLDPNVLLSAGHDGLILLWDLQTGSQLASFQNTVDNSGHGAVFDAKWSPDGSMMAATDSHGHILLFGLGFVNDKIKKLPKEIFFHTDYRPLVRDASHNVLDEQTQVAPHLMPPPFLVDIDGNPYPPYLQRLVPGRENCRTEQLVPNIIMSPGGQQEVIEGLDEPRSNIDQMIQALVNRSGNDQPNASNASSSPHNNQRQSTSPRSSRGMRGRGDVEGVRQSIGNWQRDEFAWTRRRLITPLDKGTLQTTRQKVQFYATLELEEYKYEMQRTMEFKPAPMTSKEFVRRPRKKQSHAYRTRASRVEQLQSQFENPNGFSDSVSGDSVSSHNDSTARSEDLDSSSTESSSSEYSDWIAEHGLEPPKRNKRQCNKKSIPKPNINTTTAVKKQNMEVPELYRPSEWLSEVIPKKFPYYPQMGDEVMFFKEGYQLYLDAVRKRHVYELQPSQITPWGKIHIKEPELVKVIGIKYELRPPRLCCLRLAVMKQNGKLTGDRFSIKYHDVPDVIDFLVLRQTYETAIARNWDVGDRFRSMIDDGWWWGKILSRRPDAQSEFLSYFTRWDNREEENMSPWDMEPVDPDREPAEEGGSLPVLAEEINAILYHPRPDEWPGGNRDVACDRILRGLDDIMGLSVAEPFIAPVDINQYPSYVFIVEYPIDLSTIKARFENRFYRRVTAAQFDVRYLATNAEKFNEDHSPIVRHARIVTDLCLKIIKELSDIDVPVLYRHLLLESYKSESSDEDVNVNIPGPSTSQQPSTRSLRTVRATRRTAQPVVAQRTSQPFDWRRACKEMLDAIWSARDSEPFREPVDRLEHPDYDKIVSTPMDLWTIREELRGDNYANPTEFWKDIKLMFTNSKIYSPDPRSKIYAMTTRLSLLAKKLMDNILEKWRSSVRRRKRVVKPVIRRKMNRQRKNIYVQNGTASDSDDDDEDDDDGDDDDDLDPSEVGDEHDHDYSSGRNSSAVNGVTKRKHNSRLGRRKKFMYNSDGQDFDDVNERRRKIRANRERFDTANDHTYHSNSSKQSPRRVTNNTVIGGGIRRGRKRRKPPSDSESNHSQKATSLLVGRPKRSIKRKNYAAMVASGSESFEDNEEEKKIVGSSMKKVIDKGKSLMKNDYKRVNKGSQKKAFENNKINNNDNSSNKANSNNVNYNRNSNHNIYSTRRAFLNKQDKSKSNVGMRTRPNKKYINYEEFGTISSYESDDEVLPKKFNKNASSMRTRPIKKIVNYDNERSLTTSASEQNNSDEDDYEEDKAVSVRVRRKRNINNDTKGTKLKNDTTNGFPTYRVTRVHKKVVYNEEEDDEDDFDDDDDDENENGNFRQNEHEDDIEEIEEEEDDDKDENSDDDDDDDDDEDNDDSDVEFKTNVKMNKNRDVKTRDMDNKSRAIGASGNNSRRRYAGGASSSSGLIRGRKRRKRSSSESDNYSYYDTSDRLRAGRRRNNDTFSDGNIKLRRSKRQHRPLKDENDSEGFSISSDDSERPPQYSVSSRGRIRKLSPRVRAFLRD
ncbi:bromodomain and WD repeat-containing protein isoform X2 [Lycorma delicatula]|uniref:bromodomain and WD repeat-containing protein isoform X2 n=1 Tax=Lycorma delicatula TaxID=130591 RepID=UPI003F516F72